MKLVINITKEEYESIKKHPHWHSLGKLIANGIPLPKGHGGLIGVQDAVDNLTEYKEIGIFGNYDKLIILGCIDRIKNHVKPIIKEDNEKISKSFMEDVSAVEEQLPKQSDDKIVHVGDEICSITGDKAVVQGIDIWHRYQCFTDSGKQLIIDTETFNDYWAKTGKNYPQIAEVIKQMQEDAKDEHEHNNTGTE